MNIFLFVYLPVLLWSFSNRHKAFLIYAVMRIFLNEFIPFLALPGVPMLRLSLVCDTFFLCYFLFKSYWDKRIPRDSLWGDFPLKRSFILMFVSLAMSALLSSRDTLFQGVTMFWMTSVSSYIYVVLLWKEIKSEEDLKFVIYGTGMILIVAALYGVFQFLNGFENPLMAYEQSLNPNNDIKQKLLWEYSSEDRSGLGRVSSIFAHPIGGGCICAFWCFFFLSTKMAVPELYKRLSIKNWLVYLFIFASLLMVILSNSRAPLVLFGISCLSLLRNKKILLIAVVGSIVIVLLSDTILGNYLNTFISIFDRSVEQKMGGGSNVSMRQSQFDAMFKVFFEQGMFFGDGLYSTRWWVSKNIGLLGAESVWIGLLLNQGIFGAVVYVMMMCSTATHFRAPIRKIGVVSVVAWVVCKSVTSTPGCDISMWFMVVILFYKIQDMYWKRI